LIKYVSQWLFNKLLQIGYIEYRSSLIGDLSCDITRYDQNSR
jgi:hypothetical protein